MCTSRTSTNPHKAIIVMSDGRQNTAPDIEDVSGALGTIQLCAIGIGAVNPFCFPSREAMCWHLGNTQIERAVTGQTMAQFGSQAVGMRIVDVARTVGSAPVLIAQGLVAGFGAVFAWRLPPVPSHAPSRRPSASELLAGLFVDGCRHIGLDEAGSDGVGADLAARQLLGDGFGEPDQAGLAGRVVGLTEFAALAIDGGDEHHRTGF